MPITLRPRSTAVDAAETMTVLGAAVADPVWMLARQYQTGAFIGEDGGDPVAAALSTNCAALALPDGSPLTQPQIEASPGFGPDQLDTASRVGAAAELHRLLEDADLAAVLEALTRAYPLQPVTARSPLAAFTARMPDAALFYAMLRTGLDQTGAGAFPPLPPGVSLTTDPQLEAVLRAWVGWLSAQLTAGLSLDRNPPRFWDATTLGYHVDATTQTPTTTVGLVADEYDGTAFDWFAFDAASVASGPAATAADPAAVRPAPVTFAGMPQPRFWALEDGAVNLDLIAGTDDAHALLAAFAHSYTNDWFVIPVDVPPGLCAVNSFVVTDSFGTPTTVPAAATHDGADTNWRMWDLTPADGLADPSALSGTRLFVVPTAPPLESAPVEDVLLARDELANLGSVIEVATRDGDGQLVDRNHRWLQLRPPADLTYNPATAADLADYRLGTTLPDYWYPLVAEDDGAGGRLLALAALPLGATDVSDTGVTRHVIAHAEPLAIADQEVARTGTRLGAVNRLTRVGGKCTSWLSWVRQPGTGGASSGLRFDVLGPPATAPNLVVNPDFTIARREPAPPLVGQSPTITGVIPVPGRWEVWNNADTTTTTTIEATSRPGSSGWMLHVKTGAAGCGLAQQ